MRALTHYELIVLMKNEIKLLTEEATADKYFSIGFIEHRANALLKYIAEWQALPKEDD